MKATAVKKTKPAAKSAVAKNSLKKPAGKPVDKAAASKAAASKTVAPARTGKKAAVPAKVVVSKKTVVPKKVVAKKTVAAKVVTAKAKVKRDAPIKVTAPESVAKKVAPVKKSIVKAVKTASKAAPNAASKRVAKPAVQAKSKPIAASKTKQTAAKATPSSPSARMAKAVAKTVAAKPLAAPVKKRAPKPVIQPIAPSQASVPAKVKSSQSASPVAARPIAVKPSKVSDKSKTTPSTFQSPNPATLAELGMPVRTGRPSSRLVQLTVPSIAQSVASTGAKASFTPMAPTQPIASPLASAVKKNRKLVDNWKLKPVRELKDEEIVAMSDDLYMNDTQLAFFRLKLENLKNDMLNNADKTTETLRTDTVIVPDPADRATIEEEHALELRTRDRERKLLKKIEQSIGLIDSGEYGYCDETGEPIGVGRLLARPTATLSLEAQQRRELKQKMFGD